jgi:hypothetical protein
VRDDQRCDGILSAHDPESRQDGNTDIPGCVAATVWVRSLYILKAIRRPVNDGEPVREIVPRYNVSHSTLSRL